MKEGDKDSDGGYHSENFSTFYFLLSYVNVLSRRGL